MHTVIKTAAGMADTPANLSRLHKETDVAAVFALFARCQDYFLLQDGEPPTLLDAQTLFEDVPPGRLGSELAVFGSRSANGLDAVAALLPNHPEQTVWYLPFMVIDPACRGRGLGTVVHAGLAQWARRRGAKAFQLVVLETNGGAADFWHKIGYREIGRIGPSCFKSRQHCRIELRCDLEKPETDARATAHGDAPTSSARAGC